MDFEMMHQVLRWWETHLLRKPWFECKDHLPLPSIFRSCVPWDRTYDTVDGWNPANSPVEVGSLSTIIYRVSAPSQVVIAGFQPSTVSMIPWFLPTKMPSCFWGKKSEVSSPFEFNLEAQKPIIRFCFQANLDFDLISACYYDMLFIYIYISHMNVIMYDELS